MQTYNFIFIKHLLHTDRTCRQLNSVVKVIMKLLSVLNPACLHFASMFV